MAYLINAQGGTHMQEFNLVKRGYDPEQVEKYVGQLERTIQEYKDKDLAISNAILNAQVAADNIVRNANIRAEDILKEALDRLDGVHKSVEKQKQVVKNFQDDYTDLVNRYLKTIQTKDFLEIFQSISELENYLVSFADYSNPEQADQATKVLPKLNSQLNEEARLASEAAQVGESVAQAMAQQTPPSLNADQGVSHDELNSLMGND